MALGLHPREHFWITGELFSALTWRTFSAWIARRLQGAGRAQACSCPQGRPPESTEGLFPDDSSPGLCAEMPVCSDDAGSAQELRAKRKAVIGQMGLSGLYVMGSVGHRASHKVWVSWPSPPFSPSVGGPLGGGVHQWGAQVQHESRVEGTAETGAGESGSRKGALK